MYEDDALLEVIGTTHGKVILSIIGFLEFFGPVLISLIKSIHIINLQWPLIVERERQTTL